MSEPVAKWDSSIDVARRRLRPADHEDLRQADFRARVRAVGQSWTGDRPDELLDLLTEAAAHDPDLAEVVRCGGPLLEDFLDGYRTRTSEPALPTQREIAGDLIDGREVSQETFDGLAARYVIAVVHLPKIGWSRPALREAAGPRVLMTKRECGMVLLVPDLDAERTTRIIKQLTHCLAGKGWLALVERPKAEIADGFAEAADIMRLVVAGRRPAGTYRISDVLVEYAVIRNSRVTDKLVSVLKPLRAHAMLWETLAALIDADYNRNEAARNLFIHRSTLDYRLNRIALITGWDPTSGRGAQLLTAALIADGMVAAN